MTTKTTTVRPADAPRPPEPVLTRARRQTRPVVTAAVLLVAILVLFGVAVWISDYPLRLADLIRTVTGGGSRIENAVVLDAQIPRALTAVLVGTALGMSGALTQAITRNRLATPDLLGITGGASVGVVAIITIAPAAQAAGGLSVPVGALSGAVVAAVLMYLFAWRRGVHPIRLILVGLGMTWTTQAIVSFLLTRASINDAARAQQWIVGSIDRTTWPDLWLPAATVLMAAIVIPAVVSRRLAVTALGEQIAHGLGMRVAVSYTWILLLAVVLAAVAVAVAGPIAFIALLAPPIAMALSGSPTPPPLSSGLVGSALILASDLLTRTLLPEGMPVGVMTAGIGGPVLVYLMIRTARKVTA